MLSSHMDKQVNQ